MDSNLVNSVVEEVQAFMAGSGTLLDGDEFGVLALRLYNIHRELNPVYSKYDVGPLTDWRKIPLMPISEFKNSDVGLVISDRMPFPGVEFHSSGTTKKDKSKHRMYDTETYRKSITHGFSLLVDADPLPQYRVILLSPTLTNSSLFYMMSYFAEQKDYRGVREQFYEFNDHEVLTKWLEELKDEEHPVILFGTSLAFYDLNESIRSLEGIELPYNSMMIETGGWKGREIAITPQELTEQVRKHFGIVAENTIREYSMSELSSQLYTWGNKSEVHYRNPYWLNYRLVDPLTQTEVKDGESGIIAFVDLANVWSCPFILTEDIGRNYNTEYVTSLILEGRAVNAPEKGCSLSYVEAMDN